MTFGIGTTFDYSIPFEPMCKIIARAGFKAISIGAGNIAHSGYDNEIGRRQIAEAVRANGLVVDSIHAPFGASADISIPDDRVTVEQRNPEQGPNSSPAGEDRNVPNPPDENPWRITYRPSPPRLSAVARIKNAIDAAESLSAKIVIVHAADQFPAHETRERLLSARTSLKELAQYAQRHSVRIALENMPSLVAMQVFDALLDELPELGVCYDSSHAHLSGDTFGVLRRYRDRIIATHISDNDGTADQHRLPYEGTIDWHEFSLCFERVKNTDVFMLEVETRESVFKDTQEFLEQALRRARKLCSAT